MADKDEISQIEKDIQQNLQRVYQQKVEEDVPDRLLALIEKLKNGDSI